VRVLRSRMNNGLGCARSRNVGLATGKPNCEKEGIPITEWRADVITVNLTTEVVTPYRKVRAWRTSKFCCLWIKARLVVLTNGQKKSRARYITFLHSTAEAPHIIATSITPCCNGSSSSLIGVLCLKLRLEQSLTAGSTLRSLPLLGCLSSL
jgi:hypothetical protein